MILTRILIVEDDAEKLRRIVTVLKKVPGITEDMLHDARDAAAAKLLLRETTYDLLILDISIPGRSDQLPTHNAGLDLLREILERDIYRMPVQVVGLTAYQDALDAAKPVFDLDVLQLVQYDAASLAWEERIARIARRAVVSSERETTSNSYETYLAIVTALASPELDALLDIPWNWVEHIHPSDPTVYHKGHFQKEGQIMQVVAAAAPRMGMQASAVLATKMAITFRPRFLAMTGILAGIKGECELGDILVADPSWDYESGKRTVKDGIPIFAAAPHQLSLDPFLRAKLTRMAQDTSMLDQLRREWRGERRTTLVSMHVGPVASGAAVLEDTLVIDGIRSQHRKTKGVEMETYGVFVAAEECPEPQPKVFSMKSVCDFADTSKNNDHQAYAAYTSATALRYFAERYL
jgi:nucleoside phosphorylase/CheY-like chemotaxis protein